LQKSGVYGTLKEQDTQWTHTGKENGKMKKLIALLLALMLALALAVPASAAGEDIGIIGGADGPTYILVSADPKAAATVSKEQREQNIKALGGVAGQVNVLLGDRCIAFTDAVPEVKNGRTMVPLRAALEAMGARIEFDQATKTAIVTGEKASFTHVVGSDVITRADGSTVKMDVHSYVTPSNRTMVPVRFFSQVLGYDVFWDNGYRMAFLLDEETFAEKVDSRLTILNGYLAGNAKRFDASKNYKEDVTLSGTVKVIDSIKGDRSYPYSGKASVLLGKDGMSMSLSADLGDLAELLEGLGGKLPEAYRALTVKPELEAIFSDKLYFRSPLLDAAMAKVDGTQAVSGAWYATDAVMSFPDLYESMYGSNEDYTVGKALYAMMKQGDANRFYEGWSGTKQLAAAAVELFGDETFTKSGSGYKWHFGKEELAKLLAEAIPGFIADSGVEELSIDLTLRSDGGVELKYTAAMNAKEEAAFRIDYTLTGNSSRMTVKGAVQVRNVCDVTFDAAVSVRTTSEKPLTAPPAGATIITLPPVMPIAA
jgi:copper amine oxidase domain protein